MKRLAILIIVILGVLGGWYGHSFFGSKIEPKKNSLNFLNSSKAKKSKKQHQDNKNEKNKEIKLYFGNGSILKAEIRKGNYSPKDALELLLKGPVDKNNVNYIPKNVRILSFKVENGRATVNFSKDILNPGDAGARGEELTLYSITDTLTEFSNIKEVVIQIEGKSEGEVDGYPVEDFWGHVGLYEQPFKRNEKIIK